MEDIRPAPLSTQGDNSRNTTAHSVNFQTEQSYIHGSNGPMAKGLRFRPDWTTGCAMGTLNNLGKTWGGLGEDLGKIWEDLGRLEGN